MSRFSLPFLMVSFSLLVSLSADALELSDLHLPMTREEADATLTKDYSYTVLEDMSVRRQWRLSNRVVSVDFAPKEGDKALLIYIDYRSPVTGVVCDRDVAQLLGSEVEEWQRLNSKRAGKLGMKKAEGVKFDDGRYIFRELDEDNHITRLAYYAGTPKQVRWNLAQDQNDTGVTAMGNRSDGSKGFLWKDEARRKESAASAGRADSSAAASRKNARRVTTQASTSGHTTAPTTAVADTTAGTTMIPRPEETKGLLETLQEYASKLSSTHYTIGGGVLLLLLLMRFIKQYREEKRREAVANFIMNRGQAPTGYREEDDER